MPSHNNRLALSLGTKLLKSRKIAEILKIGGREEERLFPLQDFSRRIQTDSVAVSMFVGEAEIGDSQP